MSLPHKKRSELAAKKPLWDSKVHPVFDEPTPTTAGPTEAVAMLLAAGRYSPDEIGRALGIDVRRVVALRDAPGVSALEADYRKRFGCTGAEASLLEDDDAAKTVKTLRELRDGNFGEDAPIAAIRLRAAQTMFARQLPPPKVTGDGGPKVIINLDLERMTQMRELVSSMREDRVRVEGPDIEPGLFPGKHSNGRVP